MSVRSLNKVQLIGNLTRDPELRYTPQGTPVCTFGVATNREWTDKTGQKQEETEFHRIVAWQKLAELCSQLLFKGRKVYVDGRLQTRRWTGSDNLEHQTTEVVIDNMIILDSRRREGEEERTPAIEKVKKPVEEPKVETGRKPAPKAAAGSGKGQKKNAVKDEDKKAAESASEEVKADDIPF